MRENKDIRNIDYENRNLKYAEKTSDEKIWKYPRFIRNLLYKLKIIILKTYVSLSIISNPHNK